MEVTYKYKITNMSTKESVVLELNYKEFLILDGIFREGLFYIERING